MKPIPDAALTQHIAILGKTGSGKTTTAKLAVEQVVADGARVCVLDPIKSDWWGLTSSADGKRAGLPFHILGGPRGHVPLHDAAGKAIAEVVAAGSLPLSIIDMADFRPGGQAKFFVDFAPVLLRRMRGVLYLVLEEAHLFAPKERSGIGEENMAIHWSKMLATAGRSKGIRLVVLTQRTQALHNALLGSCDSMIAHRLTAPADQEPVLKWLAANADKATTAEVSASLSSLKTGEGWLCSGEAQLFERRQFPRIKTYDNTRTPTSDDGEHHVKTAAVDTEQLKTIIGDAVKEAESNDPKELKRRIAELEKQVRQQEQAKPERVVEQVEVPIITPEQEERFFQAADAIKTAAEAVSGIGGEIAQRIVALRARARSVDKSNPVNNASKPARSVNQSPPQAVHNPTHNSSSILKTASETGIPRGESLVLRALIQYPEGLRREQLTVLTGYKRSSRDAYLQRLRERGYVETSGDRCTATDTGRAALPDAEPLPTGEALQGYWLSRLPTGERAILEVLIAAYPEAIQREALTEATGYKRSSRDAYLQRLRAKELTEEEGRGVVRAARELFE